jgi:hypothetical protein
MSKRKGGVQGVRVNLPSLTTPPFPFSLPVLEPAEIENPTKVLFSLSVYLSYHSFAALFMTGPLVSRSLFCLQQTILETNYGLSFKLISPNSF